MGWWCLEDHPRTCKWLVTSFISHLDHLEGERPQLGDLLTMVIDHLLTGMILQVVPNFDIINISVVPQVFFKSYNGGIFLQTAGGHPKFVEKNVRIVIL